MKLLQTPLWPSYATPLLLELVNLKPSLGQAPHPQTSPPNTSSSNLPQPQALQRPSQQTQTTGKKTTAALDMDQVLAFLESKGWGHSWQRQSHKVASYKHELEMDDGARMMASAKHMARRCNSGLSDSLSVDNDLSS